MLRHPIELCSTLASSQTLPHRLLHLIIYFLKFSVADGVRLTVFIELNLTHCLRVVDDGELNEVTVGAKANYQKLHYVGWTKVAILVVR